MCVLICVSICVASSESVTAECFRRIRLSLLALRRTSSTGIPPQFDECDGVGRVVSTARGPVSVSGHERQVGSASHAWDIASDPKNTLDGVIGGGVEVEGGGGGRKKGLRFTAKVS